MERKKIVLLVYEIIVGVMLILALYSASVSYEQGVKDCKDWKKKMTDIYGIDFNSSVIPTSSGNLPYNQWKGNSTLQSRA